MTLPPRTRVAMLLSNGYGPDVRAQKEAHTLACAGCAVTILAWDRECELAPQAEERIPPALDAALAGWPGRTVDPPEPVAIRRIHLAAGYRTGRRLLWKMPLFWGRLLRELHRARPAIVHANDLDTLPVAMLYGKLANIPVVYDAREYYPGMVQANVGRRLSHLLDALERRLAPRADAILTVGDRLADRLGAMGGRVWVVHNSHPLPDGPAIEAQGRARRAAWGIPEGALLLVYVGYLTPDRLLAPLLEAIPQAENTWLVIGGSGPLRSQVEAAAAACPRIRALGWIPLDEVMPAAAAGDVIYYGLNAADPNAYYFLPNLGFYALAVGRPLLTTPVGEIADLVRREGCGVVLEEATARAALAALMALQEEAWRAKLAARAHALGQDRYHWGHAASMLLRAYQSLDVKSESNR